MASRHSFRRTTNNFYERQKFKNKYFLVVVVLLELFFIYFSALKTLNHKPFIPETFEDWPLLIFTLTVPPVLLLLYYVIRLETVINDDGIFYRWRPTQRTYNMIQWDTIREITLIDLKNAGFMWIFSKEYNQVRYLGSGVGILIELKRGKRIVIGTRKAEELNRILIRMAGAAYQPSGVGEDHDYSD